LLVLAVLAVNILWQVAGDDELRKRKMQQAAEASSVAADNSRAALRLLELRGQGGSPKRQRQFMDRITGVLDRSQRLLTAGLRVREMADTEAPEEAQS
jgi:hypothetical protein